MIAREDFEEHSSWHLSRGRGGMTIRWKWLEQYCFMDLIRYESTTDRNYRRWELTVPSDEAYETAFGAITDFAAGGMDERVAKAVGQLAILNAKLTALPADANPWGLNFGNGIVGPAIFFRDVADAGRMVVVSARESQYDMSRKARVLGCAVGESGEWGRVEPDAGVIELGCREGHSWSQKALQRARSAPAFAA